MSRILQATKIAETNFLIFATTDLPILKTFYVHNLQLMHFVILSIKTFHWLNDNLFPFQDMLREWFGHSSAPAIFSVPLAKSHRVQGQPDGPRTQLPDLQDFVHPLRRGRGLRSNAGHPGPRQAGVPSHYRWVFSVRGPSYKIVVKMPEMKVWMNWVKLTNDVFPEI